MQVIHRKPLEMKASSGGIIEGAWRGIERKGESERRKETRRDGPGRAATLEGESGSGLTNGGHAFVTELKK